MNDNKKPQKYSDFSSLGKAAGLSGANVEPTPTTKKVITLKKAPGTMPIKTEVPNNNQNRNCPNIGWMFYKDYFKGVRYGNISKNKVIEADDAKLIKEKNQKIIDSKWVSVNDGLGIPYQVIDLKVTYPGLVTGLGIAHESGVEGEFKLGLHFDYTFGQPIIHGSSVKGLLRSVFPIEGKNKQGEDKDKRLPAKLKFFNDTIPNKLKNLDESQVKKTIKDIEKEIFEGIRSDGSRIDIYHRDVFFDAILTEADNRGRILESDAITPHGSNPLKNPTPLAFLKISPGCTIQFRFDLKEKDSLLTVAEKIALFTEILNTLGVGAKTNVGYGQFET